MENDKQLKELILLFKINFIYISEKLFHFKEQFLNYCSLTLIDKDYNTNTNININDSILIFGVYTKDDIEFIKKSNCKIYILFAGSDIDLRISKNIENILTFKKLNNITFISISDDIKTRLEKCKIPSIRAYLNMVNPLYFPKVKITDLGNNIYIYNGRSRGREILYGKTIYEKVVINLKEFNFIYSNQINIPHSKINILYKSCFIGLRLTKYDGNANTVQEFNAMNIPIIFNSNERHLKSIKWKNEIDIIRTIRLSYLIKVMIIK